MAYICFGKSHRQSGWAYSIKPWVLLCPLHHQTPPMLPTIALMVAQHPNLSCFAMLTSCCYLFSVRPEMSPWTALESEVVQSMSCTHRKKWKEQNINNRTFKNNGYQKPTQQSNCFFVLGYGKSTQILHQFEVTIKYSREGAVQEISNKESWRTIGTNRARAVRSLWDKSPSFLMQHQGFFTTDEKCCQSFLLHLLF